MKHLQTSPLNSKPQRGFVAISIVLVLLAVAIAVSLTVALLSIGEAQSGLALTQGENTLSFVEGCTEDALLKTRANISYTGGNITRPEGTCTVSISKGGNVWTLTVSTITTSYTRTIKAIVIQDGYGDTITSWQEI